MKKILLLFLLVCMLSVGDNQIPLLPVFVVKYSTSAPVPVPMLEPVGGSNGLGTNETNSVLSGILGSGGDLGNNVTVLSSLVGDLSSFAQKSLLDFLNTQINFFKGKLLFIFDDQERPFQLKLEIPDFNFFNLMSDLNQKVTFLLYDKKAGNSSFDILKFNDENALNLTRFNPKRPTVFITHGYLTSSNGAGVTLVRDAYLKKGDYNVIAVNWKPLSFGSYTIARLLVPKVGKHVGDMINFLYKHGMNPNTTTLVGHSLGAHVMGFAGQTAIPKVNHTIGLDPAWPLFVMLGKDERLSDDDAQYVEVIHTNSGLLGIPSITGHYDFFPNGGFSQNGCEGAIFSACSHSRAYKYLAEELAQEGPDYYAVQCDTYPMFTAGHCSHKKVTIMGALDSVAAAKGHYYLNTKKSEPFGLGLHFP